MSSEARQVESQFMTRDILDESRIHPAIRQKIRALGQRGETEPRDVFDLDLLLARHPAAVRPGDVPTHEIDAALRAVFAIGYDAYYELVVDFLEDEQVGIYGREEVWTDMVLKVAATLEAMR